MPRQMHATVDDKVFIDMKVAAARHDTNISSLLRAIFAEYLANEQLQATVAARIEPERRGGRQTPRPTAL